MAGTEPELIARIRSRIQNPVTAGQLDRMVSAFEKDESFWREWVESVDGSSHPVEEWIAAVNHLLTWGRDQGRPLTGARVLGYLDCCEAVAGPMAGDLDATVVQMLREHGVSDLD